MAAGEPFVGRGDELAVLADAWRDARAGRSSLVLVWGEPGIGKTALIRRFLDTETSAGAIVLRAACDAGEVGLPFGVVGQLAVDVPAAVRGPLLTAGPPAAADPLAVGAELLTALGELQASGPVVVVVDDAQWADDPSAGALAFGARRLRTDQVLILLGVRQPEPPELPWWDRMSPHAPPRRIELGGLGAEEIMELGTAVGGHPFTAEAARRLAEHTGGHPMHAASLLRELPSPVLLDVSTPLPAPRSLATLVLVRVAALSPLAQDLVLAAAVLGSRCPVGHAVALAGVPDPAAVLDEVVTAGLLAEVVATGGRDMAFPHQLLRAAVYGDIPPGRRRALHRAAAELVGGAAGLAHRVAAAIGPDPTLAAGLEALARDDRAAGRWRSAADHLLAAADLSGSPEERATRVVAGVATMLAGGDLAGALRREPEVRALPETPARSRVLGRLEASTGRLRDARMSLTAALAAAGEDDAGRASAATHLALLSFVEGDADAAAELSARALRWSPPSEDVPVARFVRMVAEVVRGGPSAVIPISRSDGHTAEEIALRGVLALWREDAATAADVLSAVVHDGSAGFSLQGRVLLLAQLSEAQYRTGDWDGATANGEVAVSLARDAGVVMGTGTTNALASYVASGRGVWDVATARVEAASAMTRVLPWWGGRAYAATSAAVLAQARGDHAAMVEALRPFADPDVGGPVGRAGILPWRALRVEALLGVGRLEEADAELAVLEERATLRPPGWSALEAARLRAELTERRDGPAKAREAYERALDLADHVRAEPSRAWLEIAYGRHLIAAGERRPGVDLVRTAHERLGHLGALPFLERSDGLLRAAGLHQPTAGGPLGLTSQEVAVARLVAEGMTNQEVGASLYVTSRTVAFHLSNIYAKLGISSRRQLAGYLPDVRS